LSYFFETTKAKFAGLTGIFIVEEISIPEKYFYLTWLFIEI